jgi:hypothetical protein
MVESCPVETRDITLNLRNRGKAIDKANYGPMDPEQRNDRFWSMKARAWDVTPDEAKTQLCGNCSAFNQTSAMIECIRTGIEGKDTERDAMDVIEAGDLGYCEIFDFKCASSRTCDAWIVGGPIKDEGDEGDEAEDEYEYTDEDDELAGAMMAEDED